MTVFLGSQALIQTRQKEEARLLKEKSAGRDPRQEIARQTKNRVQSNTTRRHKSDPRGLPVFPTTGGGRGE